MEINTIKDAFDRVTKKQKLASSKSQELIDQIIHEIEDELSKLKAGSSLLDDQKSNLTELKEKLNKLRPHDQLEASLKELNISLNKYMKLLDRNFNPDISKAYRNVDFDTQIVNQIIATHFYRLGLFDLGDSLVSEANDPEAAALKSQFVEMHQILQGIRIKNLEPALNWVAKNKEKLRQNGSNLELKLHQQQFVEIVQKGNRSDALQYARTHLAQFALSHMTEIQKLMASILWARRLEVSPYPELMAQEKWETLADDLSRQFCRVLGQSYESPLSVVIKAGEEGLPTLLKCVSVMPPKQDWQAMKYLPVPIELSKEFQYHSIFVCPVSKDQSSDDNPAMLMVCGHVLCKHSITKLSKGNSRTFKCPYCPSEILSVSQCRQLHF